MKIYMIIIYIYIRHIYWPSYKYNLLHGESKQFKPRSAVPLQLLFQSLLAITEEKATLVVFDTRSYGTRTFFCTAAFILK